MRQVGRGGLVALGFLLAVAPLSAYAEDGNQVAIDKAKAENQWLMSLPLYEQGVAIGQGEIANAKAIARLFPFDGRAQTQIPNSMVQYTAFCAAAIQHMQAKVNNAAAMAADKPWDAHAQAEVANANAMMHSLWNMIGDSYPGNPYYKEVRSPSQAPIYSDDQALIADDQVLLADDEQLMAVDDNYAVVATLDEAVFVAEDVTDGLAN